MSIKSIHKYSKNHGYRSARTRCGTMKSKIVKNNKSDTLSIFESLCKPMKA